MWCWRLLWLFYWLFLMPGPRYWLLRRRMLWSSLHWYVGFITWFQLTSQRHWDGWHWRERLLHYHHQWLLQGWHRYDHLTRGPSGDDPLLISWMAMFLMKSGLCQWVSWSRENCFSIMAHVRIIIPWSVQYQLYAIPSREVETVLGLRRRSVVILLDA